MIVELVIVAGAYLLGSIPSAYIVVRLIKGSDIRRTGSGNVGATNTVRAAGWSAGVLVALMDIAKGVVPVLVMKHWNPEARWLGAAAVAAVVGHCFPVWLRFKGGKGVATALGAFATLAPWAVLCAAGVWIVLLGLRRIVSLASVVAVASFPVFASLVQGMPFDGVVATVVVALIVIFRHLGNLKRLAAGTEPRLGENHTHDGGDA